MRRRASREFEGPALHAGRGLLCRAPVGVLGAGAAFLAPAVLLQRSRPAAFLRALRGLMSDAPDGRHGAEEEQREKRVRNNQSGRHGCAIILKRRKRRRDRRIVVALGRPGALAGLGWSKCNGRVIAKRLGVAGAPRVSQPRASTTDFACDNGQVALARADCKCAPRDCCPQPCWRSATSLMKRASSPLASHSASAEIAASMSVRSSISALA